MNIIKSLLTEHLLAKFFAVALAAVTIWLVNRELEEVWIEGEIAVVIKGQSEQPGRHRIVLEPQGEVAILSYPAKIHVRIKGPRRERPTFDDRLDIVVKVREGWANADPDSAASARSAYTLDVADIVLGLGETVEFLETGDRQIVVDLFEKSPKLLPVRLAPIDESLLPEDKWVDSDRTRVSPEMVYLRGPRSNLTLEAIEARIEPRDRYEAGVYGLDIDEDFRKRRLSVVLPEGIPRLQIHLALKDRAREFDLQLGELPVSWLIPDESVRNMVGGNLQLMSEIAKPSCQITLSVTKAQHDRWNNEAEKARLLETIRVFIEPAEEIAGTRRGGEKAPRLPLHIIGLPGGVGVRDAKMQPSDLPVKIVIPER